MNRDEATFLTAFLDGELTAEHRLGVESALVSDPRLADDLRALSAVRDLVAGLSRPVSPDVSAAVVARVAGRRSRPFGLGRFASPGLRVVRAAVLLATAAALVVAATPWLRLVRAPGRNQVARTSPPPQSVTNPEPPSVAAGRTSAPTLATSDLPDPAPGDDERRAEADRRLVRSFLDSPNVRSALIVTDVLGGADRQVGEILESLPRRQSAFGTIVVPQGILFDPEHPGVTKFFAAVMDDREYRQFQERLARAFPEPVEVVTPRPELLTRLSNVDQVAVRPGKPVADLIDPLISAERVRAIRSTPGRERLEKSRIVKDQAAHDPLHDPANPVIEANGHEEPTPEQERSGPHPSLRDRPGATLPTPPVEKRPPPEQPTSPVVLVYITSAHKHTRGSR